jgi:hypothetical protein
MICAKIFGVNIGRGRNVNGVLSKPIRMRIVKEK